MFLIFTRGGRPDSESGLDPGLLWGLVPLQGTESAARCAGGLEKFEAGCLRLPIGTDQVWAFGAGFVQGGLHGGGDEFFAVGMLQDGAEHVVLGIQPPRVMRGLHDEGHAVVETAHGFVRDGGEDEEAHFGDGLAVRVRSGDVPEAGEAKRPAIGFGEPDGGASRTGLFPLVKAIGGDEAALVGAFAEIGIGQDGFAGGVDERALVPGNGPAPADLWRGKSAIGFGQNDGGFLGGRDIVARTGMDDAFGFTQWDDEVAVGGEGVAGGHEESNNEKLKIRN